MRLVITQNITLDGVIDQNEETCAWFTTADGAGDTADVEKALTQDGERWHATRR